MWSGVCVVLVRDTSTDCRVADSVCICPDLNLKKNKSLKKGPFQLVCHYCWLKHLIESQTAVYKIIRAKILLKTKCFFQFTQAVQRSNKYNETYTLLTYSTHVNNTHHLSLARVMELWNKHLLQERFHVSKQKHPVSVVFSNILPWGT